MDFNIVLFKHIGWCSAGMTPKIILLFNFNNFFCCRFLCLFDWDYS